MVQKAGLKMLRSFARANKRTFVELCQEAGYPTDLGGYYLRQLVAADYLAKQARGEYTLTPKGRAHASRVHVVAGTTPRLHVLLVPRLGDDIVLLQRTWQPFIQRKEWPATAVMGGEQAADAVNRLLTERLAPADEVMFVGVFRRMDHYGDDLFDDKVFLVHSVKLERPPQVEVVNGNHVLVAAESLADQPNKSRSLVDIYAYAGDSKRPLVLEQRYDLTYEDFETAE
jgi:hypothetical protein